MGTTADKDHKSRVELVARIMVRLDPSGGPDSELYKRTVFALGIMSPLHLEFLLNTILTSRTLNIHVSELDDLEIETFKKFLNW